MSEKVEIDDSRGLYTKYSNASSLSPRIFKLSSPIKPRVVGSQLYFPSASLSANTKGPVGAAEYISGTGPSIILGQYVAFSWFEKDGDENNGQVKEYKKRGAIVRRENYTAFVVLRPTVYQRFVDQPSST